MTDDEVERAITDLSSYAGRQFERSFAELATKLYDDINNWDETAKRCGTISPDALFEERVTCWDRNSRFHKRWYEERIKGISDESAQGRMRILGNALGAREHAKCFVSLEGKFFSQKKSAVISSPVEARSVRSNIPLNLTIPTTFDDVTNVVYEPELKPRPSVKVYCSPDDAQLSRAQLRGKRIDELPAKGCFAVSIAENSTYFPDTGKFSEEDNANFWKQTNPRSESRVTTSKRKIRGIPTYSLTVELVTEASKQKLYFLYIADDSKVWEVTYNGGRQEDLGQAIWDAFINRL
jgi:hypothetical protein